MQMTASSYAKRPPTINELAILGKLLYAIIAAINYPHITYYMIYKYICWKIKRKAPLNVILLGIKFILLLFSHVK
jgi:hypothetical protein